MARFEWDPDKDRLNRAKHGIGFAEASAVFGGDHITIEDATTDEVREKTFGLIRGVLVLCVVHTDREGAIRIISARTATPNERRYFNAYFR
jgi:uncharacterized DUF497 family protein